MRYLKAVVLVLIVGFIIFEVGANAQALGQNITFNVSLPFYPLGVLSMPVWVALLLAFVLAFFIAVLLDVVAWYEYTRTIRLQRQRIKALQEELDKREGGRETPSE